MRLDLRIDARAAAAPFEQVRDGLQALVDAGALPAGTRLPSVRALAAELGLAANTVARAYKERETAGTVLTRGRAGTVVADDDAEHAAKAAAAEFAARARALGLGTDRALALVRAALG